MSDPPDEQGASNSGILLIVGVIGALLALVAFPSAFLLLAAVVAVCGLAAAFLGKGTANTDSSSTVQLQQLPRKASSRELPPQAASSEAVGGLGSATAAQLPSAADAPLPVGRPPAATPEQPAAADSDFEASDKSAATFEGDSVSAGAARSGQSELQQQAPPPPPPQQAQKPQQQQRQQEQQPAAAEPVVTSTFTSSGTSSHTSSSTHTVAANGGPPRTTGSATQSGSAWSAAGEGPAPAPAQLQQQAQQQQAQQPAGRPAAGGAAILARLKAQRAQAQKASKAAQPAVTVLYASQTGTAQEIARSIQAASAEHGVKSQVMSCNELGWEGLSAEKTPVVVLVASSTGDGDAPDNAAKFFATMKRRSQEKGQLKGISITVLGLGDSNYTRFCAVPRAFRNRLAELGATPFYKATDCDEVDGLEDTIDEWVDGLWPALKQQLAERLPGGESQTLQNGAAKPEPQTGAAAQSKAAAGEASLEGVPPLPACRVRLIWEEDAGRAAQVSSAERAHPTEAEAAHRDPAGWYSREAPFWARIAEASVMTAPDSDRRVLHLGMDVAGSGMQYSPGDSIGVVAQNDEALVDALLERLGAGGGRVFSVAPAAAPDGSAADGADGSSSRLLEHLGWPCTLRTALLRGCDLTGAPRKSLLRLLAEHCSDAGERTALLRLSSRGGRDAYNAEIRDAAPSLLDLLRKFPSCAPPLDALLDALPALAPRLYSMACSPLQQPDQVDVALSVVRMETPFGTKRGVATTWLDRLAAPLTSGRAQPDPALVKASDATPCLPVFLRSGGAFHPPADLSKPVIYIGPGTGVAPFRGFLQHRRRQLADFAGTPGEAWLFFGCRRPEEDFLYRDDFEGFRNDGTLTHLHIAFSRAQAEKVYVQHIMREHGAALAQLLLRQGGSAFVCGDGAGMARDVHSALADMLAQHGGLSTEDAAAELARMATDKRYVRDIWS